MIQNNKMDATHVVFHFNYKMYVKIKTEKNTVHATYFLFLKSITVKITLERKKWTTCSGTGLKWIFVKFWISC